MDIDLPFILFWVVAACGAIWLFDVLVLRPRRLEQDPEAPEPALVEYARSFFPVLLLVLLLRSFVAEPYQIPSESMVPTLEVGDFILVNKYAYGLRLPVFGTKIMDVNEPRRGDIMVFVPPHDSRYFIKRVIGLPGDVIRYENKALFINGERMGYELVGDVIGRDAGYDGIRAYIEQLTDTDQGAPHTIYRSSRYEPALKWEIPPGRYLMLGDNRDKSDDSRFWGLAREEQIVGKAVAIWLHKDPGWNLPNFSRNQWLNEGVVE